MTTQQILKLDAISSVFDLAWSRESYDTGHPKCICSACGVQIKSHESFLDDDNYYDSAGNSLEDQAHDNFPIRMYRGKSSKMEEAVLHLSCYNYLTVKGIIQ